MGVFKIEPTGKTPDVEFNPETGNLTIKGNCLPPNAQEFYLNLFVLVDEYLKKPKDKTSIIFKLEYFNTSSSKILLQLLMKFEILASIGKEILFTWYYDADDIDMHDAGATYENSIKIPTELVAVTE